MPPRVALNLIEDVWTQSGSINGSERVNLKITNPATPAKNALDIKPKTFSVSGDEENRTLDLLHAMQALYQLSYVPINVVTITDL